MGPQSGSCGYADLAADCDWPGLASMGPQSGSCGYLTGGQVAAVEVERFNGSTVW